MEPLRIYLASSWKNEKIVNNLAKILRGNGYVVDAFTDTSTGRFVFHFSEIGPIDKLQAISFLKDSRSQKAFQEDKKWLNWCDCCILLLPAGKSTHLEAGYAKGCGKKLVIYHPERFPLGEFDVMYGFADILVEGIHDLLTYLEHGIGR